MAVLEGIWWDVGVSPRTNGWEVFRRQNVAWIKKEIQTLDTKKAQLQCDINEYNKKLFPLSKEDIGWLAKLDTIKEKKITGTLEELDTHIGRKQEQLHEIKYDNPHIKLDSEFSYKENNKMIKWIYY